MNLVTLTGALLCGVMLTTQVATNKQLGQALHNLYIPAVVNMVIGLAATVALTLTLSREYPTGAMIRSAPLVTWFAGGILGAAYLTGAIVLAPRLGAAALIGLVVTGQLVFSVLCDNYGWFGFTQHGANLPRVLGCLLLIGGVTLVSRY